MDFVDLVILFGAVGVCVILTRGSIFEPLRNRGPPKFQEFSSCPLCFGFWIGLAVSLTWYGVVTLAEWGSLKTITFCLLYGGVVSVSAYTLVHVLDHLHAAVQIYHQRTQNQSEERKR